MYVLGLNCSLNSSAALVKDGKLIACAEEERFTRKKHQVGTPFLSIQYCLDYANISINDVDRIEVGWSSAKTLLRKNLMYAARKPQVLLTLPTIINRYKQWNNKVFSRKFFDDKNLKKKIFFNNHHLSHSASAYYPSGFKYSNVISIDSMGEVDSTMLSIGKNQKELKVIKIYQYLDSLGSLYSRFTRHLGFKPHSHEGKTMGLASYGFPIYDTHDMVKFTKNGYTMQTWQNTMRYTKFILNNAMQLVQGQNVSEIFSKKDPLFEHFGPMRKKDEKLTARHAHIAATIQNIQEKILIKLAQNMYDKTGIKNFALAGGSNLNCVANGALNDQEFCRDIFVQPAAGDNGCAIGAAFLGWTKLGKKANFKMEHAYWGPEFTNEEIKDEIKMNKIIKKNKYTIEYHDDIEGVCAEYLNDFKLIGWFQGRMEIGPRALGNRTILANPTKLEVKDAVNERVKHREGWRPFAPSLLLEAAEEYLDNPYPSPYMILSSRVPQHKWKDIPAVIHVDGTVRPQTVTKDTNPRYYRVIKEFEKLSGVPVVLNTSFNDNEEPIVCTPYNAIRAFSVTGLDMVAMGNYLVKK